MVSSLRFVAEQIGIFVLISVKDESRPIGLGWNWSRWIIDVDLDSRRGLGRRAEDFEGNLRLEGHFDILSNHNH